MMSDKKDYFDYIENVLGVKSILFDIETPKAAQHFSLLVFTENLETYSEDEKGLLAKILASLKMDLKQIHVVSLNEKSDLSSDFSIYFLNEPEKMTMKKENSITTYSPRVLLRNAQFKKNVWDELQTVISFFKRSN